MRDKYSDIRDHISVSRSHRFSTIRIETIVMFIEGLSYGLLSLGCLALSCWWFLSQSCEKSKWCADIISVTRYCTFVGFESFHLSRLTYIGHFTYGYTGLRLIRKGFVLNYISNRFYI